MSKTNKNDTVKNLKGNIMMDNSSEIPTVEFDFSSTTIEHCPATTQAKAKHPSLFDRKNSFKKYINPNSPHNKSTVINTFAPNKQIEGVSEGTIELNDQKLEAVRKMNKIIKNNILMNYMIKWIENGFMHFPEGSVSPIPEKDEILECSAIEKEDDRFLHPITEESLGEIEREILTSDQKRKNFENYRLEKLRQTLEM